MRTASRPSRPGAPDPSHRIGALPGGALREEVPPSSSAGAGLSAAANGAAGGVTSVRTGRHRHPAYVTPRASRSARTVPTSPSTPVPYRSSTGGQSQGCTGQVGRAAPAGPPPVGPQDWLQCPTEAGQVPVIDAAVVQLTGKLTEQPRPVPAGRLEGNTDLDPPLDHMNGRPTGGRRAALFPGGMRQVAEHHLAMGPRLRRVIGPPHHPQVVAAVRRSGPAAAGAARSGRGRSTGACCHCSRRCCSRARRRARYSGVPLAPMP